ncbi:hypothetical protein ORD22_13725 [Sporosarcina sp. GW1-11]|uniref:hypothetical protein n=1 Tax=Sporosarcina sp. GW1-11 TaxID=2899126 RepID=UPI00294F3597|nr:hypothetical protein [Sporosarcina sp. GW1-11]MDV6379274.1 hypothetical protein [Sporosarcina sp. GW1-11]
MIQKTELHILNGMEMYRYFKETHFLETELMIPFNEAMCYGNTCEDLFSDEFIEIRAKVHNVTPAQYTEVTLCPLQPLFCSEVFNRIALWFDEDMFCQINLLTILAWLDQANYKGTIDLQIVGDNFQPVDYYVLKAKGYYSLYKQVVIHKIVPQNVHPRPLGKGIELYLTYLNKDSDLMLYIQRHKDFTTKELVAVLIEKFQDLGLADTQYLEIIKSQQKNV